MSRHLVALLVFLGTLPALAQPPRAEVISLARKIKVMDAYLYTASYVQEVRSQASMNGVKLNTTTEKITVAIAADMEVTAITDDGQEKEKLITIRSLTMEREGTFQDILHTGAKLRVRFSDSGNVFFMDKRPVNDSISAVLASVVISAGGERTARIIGTTKPVRPGDTWPVNAKAIAGTFDDTEVQLPRKGLKGTVRYERIDSTPGQKPAAVFSSRITASGIRFANQGIFKPKKASATITVSYAVPLDERYPPTESASEIVVDSKGIIQDAGGPAVDLDMQTKRSLRAKFQR